MHAIHHSLAYRAPPATRTKLRWQPYTQIPPTPGAATPSVAAPGVQSRSPSQSNIHHHSSNNPNQLAPVPLGEVQRLKHALPKYSTQSGSSIVSSSSISSISNSSKEQARATNANKKHVQGLVDQAVKTLDEVWNPHDVPAVFLSTRADVDTPSVSSALAPRARRMSSNTQLPSPVSPKTQQPSPPAPPIEALDGCNAKSSSSLLPLRSFVHEVLRRSKTSGCVLQTALCYLEAIRSKVPELAQAEREGRGQRGEIDASFRIVKGTPEDTDGLFDLGLGIQYDEDMQSDKEVEQQLLATVRVEDINREAADSFSTSLSSLPTRPCLPHANSFSNSSSAVTTAQQPSLHQSKPPLPPLPPLPPPLLCPRRAFLASLILATKFIQDRCYSNRAWAKLSGLPPREIGRCERALGEALGWRLWVGKSSTATESSTVVDESDYEQGTVGKCRTFSRSRSDGAVFEGGRWVSRLAPATSTTLTRSGTSLSSATRGTAGLRRAGTLPDGNAFSPSVFTQTTPVAFKTRAHNPRVHAIAHVNYPFTTTFPSAARPTNRSTDSLVSSDDDSSTTPSLTHSPSSTESGSSIGDRTIQMSGFMDDVVMGCLSTNHSVGQRKLDGTVEFPTIFDPEEYTIGVDRHLAGNASFMYHVGDVGMGLEAVS